MAIEFGCPFCGQSLKTTDDKAGSKAQCPGCAEVIAVPEEDRGSLAESTAIRPSVRRNQSSADYADSFGDPESANEFDQDERSRDSSSGQRSRRLRSCPMCGESVSRSTAICPACGEPIHSVGPGTPDGRIAALQVRDILGSGWKIFRSNLGICMGVLFVASLTVGIVGGILSVAISFIPELLIWNAAMPGVTLVIIWVIGFVAAWYFLLGIQLGIHRVYLDVVTGTGDGMNRLFSCMGRAMQLLGVSLLMFLIAIPYGLVVSALRFFVVRGFLGSILSSFLSLALVVSIWPLMWVILDHEGSSLHLLRTAFALTSGNRWRSFLIFLVLFALCSAVYLCGGFLVTGIAAMVGEFDPIAAIAVFSLLILIASVPVLGLYGYVMTCVSLMYCRIAGYETTE